MAYTGNTPNGTHWLTKQNTTKTNLSTLLEINQSNITHLRNQNLKHGSSM